MQRSSPLLALALAALFVVPGATAAFGSPTTPGFDLHEGPGTAPEPTIGIPWNTDSVFYHSLSTTYRLRFDEAGQTQWEDVTPPYQVPLNLDPMLIADEDTGRVWAGGLFGPCSVMMHTDDDGETWLPTGNMCSGADFDHQSIGSGPSNSPLAGIAYPHAQYYCGQLGTISCATSYDGGETWGPFIQEQTVCGGFHGHIRVSRPSGMMAVPVPDCGGELGMLTTTDGIIYTAKTIPGSETWTNGFDPSLQFGRDAGWLWYGMASENGIHISLSKDDGDTWEPLGPDGSASLEIGQLHDPPVVAGTFADVQVGDDDRVAFSFIGIEEYDGIDMDYVTSNAIYGCAERQDELIWHYYVAFTYDGGRTWDVVRASDDPVQVGGVYDVVVDGPGNCRNLLDFNDMDIDSKGRVYISFADGCIGECAETSEPDTDGYRAQATRLYRQVEGRGLFAAFDTDDGTNGTTGPGTTGTPGGDAGQQTPFVGVAVLAGVLGALALVRRRD